MIPQLRRAAPKLAGAFVLGVVCAEAARLAGVLPRQRALAVGPSRARRLPRSARALEGAAALLAASVLADSAVEHYRGSFKNAGMFAPLISSALTLLAGGEGATFGAARARAYRKSSFAMAVAVGAIGAGFHVYDVFRRPGGLRWLNLFYGAPLGAPAALSVAGVIGLCAERIGVGATRLFGLPAGRALAALSSFALAGTVAEAALLHFRGAFHNPFMWIPVTLPPVASGLMAKAALQRPSKPRHPLTRAWLWVTAIAGFVGVGFHAYGVSRAMGGWRNWSQNVVDGPPLPAPPAFSALALSALTALSLLEESGG
ncbi:MAG: hypothetical protein ACR65T_10335 [Methylocystis sp.]|uniref:hypothetical protein n=1 Tax=Methylocystis sp. TaxID=1911079 RepID=UPI003DA1D202